MSVDLNRLADRLKSQRPVGVNQNGQLTPTDPGNDRARGGNTRLEPKRFFIG